jgi:hypothetical protein
VGERELTVHVILNDKAIREISKDLEAKLRADGSANLSGQNPDPAGASQRVSSSSKPRRVDTPEAKVEEEEAEEHDAAQEAEARTAALMGPSAAA